MGKLKKKKKHCHTSIYNLTERCKSSAWEIVSDLDCNKKYKKKLTEVEVYNIFEKVF